MFQKRKRGSFSLNGWNISSAILTALVLISIFCFSVNEPTVSTCQTIIGQAPIMYDEPIGPEQRILTLVKYHQPDVSRVTFLNIVSCDYYGRCTFALTFGYRIRQVYDTYEFDFIDRKWIMEGRTIDISYRD